MSFELLVRRARLRGRAEGLHDIAIREGRIAAIGHLADAAAGIEIDARGGLASESFVNPHLHLCKVYTLSMMDDEAVRAYHGAGMANAMSTIELAARVKATYDESWIIRNVRRAVAAAAYHGTTHLRALADVDGKARLEGVKALLRARDEFKGVVDIQVVAFAQDGLAREPGAADLMRQAMALGADVVGGIPWIEYDISDAYYPFGRNSMLEVAFLASHLLWMTTRPEMETLYDMITTRAARAMGVRDHELKVGAPANLVVLDAPDVLEALREHTAPVAVISRGKLVDQSRMRALSRHEAGTVSTP